MTGGGGPEYVLRIGDDVCRYEAVDGGCVCWIELDEARSDVGDADEALDSVDEGTRCSK